MQIEKFSVTLGATINTGNYENIRRDVTVVAVLSEEDEDYLPEARIDVLHQAHQLLAQSLVSDLHTSFSVKGYWTLDNQEGLRSRLQDNPIFEKIAAHAPMLADELVNEFWAEYTPLRDKQLKEEAEKKAERERVLAELNKPVDHESDGDDTPEPSDTDEEDTAEADYDDEDDLEAEPV